MFHFLPVLIAVLSFFSGSAATWSEASLPPFVKAPAQIVTASNSIGSPAMAPAGDTTAISVMSDGPKIVTKLDRYVELASRTLDPRMHAAMQNIEDPSRRLLALRYYARQRGNISARWSLSANQIQKYNMSKQHLLAVAAVRQIQTVFAEQNPGYYVKVNTDVRTVENQLEIWNTFASVGQAGESLQQVANRSFSDSSKWPETPSEADLGRFQALLRSTPVWPTPTAAVPGFSLHGSGRAFDFIIRRISDDQIIAGADATTTGSVWDKPGWTAKLRKAVMSVSKRFDGPLRGPYEPWHYNYNP